MPRFIFSVLYWQYTLVLLVSKLVMCVSENGNSESTEDASLASGYHQQQNNRKQPRSSFLALCYSQYFDAITTVWWPPQKCALGALFFHPSDCRSLNNVGTDCVVLQHCSSDLVFKRVSQIVTALVRFAIAQYESYAEVEDLAVEVLRVSLKFPDTGGGICFCIMSRAQLSTPTQCQSQALPCL